MAQYPFQPAWALWAVLQAVCPSEIPFLMLTSAGSLFHHGLGCHFQGWRQRVQVRPRGQLSMQLMSPLCVPCRVLSGQGSVLCPSPATWKLLIACPPGSTVNSSPDKKCHHGRLVPGCPLGQLARLAPGRAQEVFQDLFVQEAILITSAQAGGRARLVSEIAASGRDGEGSWH